VEQRLAAAAEFDAFHPQGRQFAKERREAIEVLESLRVVLSVFAPDAIEIAPVHRVDDGVARRRQLAASYGANLRVVRQDPQVA
jgi:hypothetical protein